MIWLILTNTGILWTDNAEYAKRRAKSTNVVIVPLPILYDGREPSFLCPPNLSEKCVDETHCCKFGCLLYNEDGSRKTVQESRHSIWDGEL